MPKPFSVKKRARRGDVADDGDWNIKYATTARDGHRGSSNNFKRKDFSAYASNLQQSVEMEGPASTSSFVDPELLAFNFNSFSCHLLAVRGFNEPQTVFASTCKDGRLLLPVRNNMEGDDVIYLCLLLLTIAVGEFIRRLDNAPLKQTVGTAIGIIVVFIVSGFHILHCLVTAIINAVIICFVSPK